MRTLSAELTAAQKSYNVQPKWKVDLDKLDYTLLTSYTEYDPSSKLAVTGTRVTFSALQLQQTAYLSKDYGAGYYTDDFTFNVTINISAVDVGAAMQPFQLVNTVDDLYATLNGSGPALSGWVTDSTDGFEITIKERYNSATYTDTSSKLTLGTTYYLTYVRDESVGTYGTYYCYIYSDIYRDTLVDTLTLTLHAKVDFRYRMVAVSWGQGGGANDISGYVEYVGELTTDTYNENDYLLDIKHTDRQYSSTAELLFTNHDGTFTDNDYIGQKAVIYYGMLDTTGTAAYSACAPMWVKNQNLISGRGALLCRVELIGLFDLLDQDHASAEYTQTEDDTDNVDTLFAAVCGATLAPFTHCTAVTVVDTDKDTMFDTYHPLSAFSINFGESRLSVLKRLVALTGSVMRVDNDGSNGAQITVFAPTTTGATYDYDYELAAGEHAFFAKGVTNRIVLPNKVTVSTYPDSTEDLTGNATDAASYVLLPKEEFWYLPVSSDDDYTCADLATAILLHYQIGNGSGSGEVVMNVGAELYDYVDIIDSRESDTIVGNTLYQYRHCGRGKWNMTIGFGEPELSRGFLDIATREPDKENLLNEVNRLRYDMDTLIGYLNRIEGDVADHSRMLSPNGLTASILRNAMQPYTIDLIIEAKNANTIFYHIGPTKGANLTTDGNIHFADGRSQNIQYTADGGAGSAAEKDVDGVQWLYFTMGSEDLALTSTWADAIGSNKGIVALCVENTAGDGDCMILPCNGREPLINAIAISVDYLSAINADMGTLTAGLIKLLKSGTTWTSWKNPNTASGMALGFDEDAYESTGDAKLEVYSAGDIGTAINKWGITLFDEDKSFVTCKTVGAITAIATSGGGAAIQLTVASHGLTTSDEIVIHGTDDYNGKYAVASVVDANNITVAVAFVANETTGTLYKIQCKVDSNGAITSSNGVLRIDENGLTIKAQNASTAWLRFEDTDGNLLGQVRLTAAEDMNFVADNDLWVWCGAGSGGDIQLYCENGGGIYCTASEGFTVPGMSAAPSSPSAGTIYFDSDDSKLKVYNGGGWDDLN